MSELKQRTMIGRVMSDKCSTTRIVEVEWARVHPKYGKVQRKQTRYPTHDPANESKLGDLIEIREVRPVSKTKTWQLVRVVEQAK